jgi:hypothetical protein
MAVRYTRIQLRPARYRSDKPPIDIWVVHALEENPPAKVEAVLNFVNEPFLFQNAMHRRL